MIQLHESGAYHLILTLSFFIFNDNNCHTNRGWPTCGWASCSSSPTAFQFLKTFAAVFPDPNNRPWSRTPRISSLCNPLLSSPPRPNYDLISFKYGKDEKDKERIAQLALLIL